METPGRVDLIPFRTSLRYWLRLGFINFGGPAGQIAIMHEELVDKKRWISENRFLHALNYCMLLPGPEAQQLAIYIGWLLNGTPGGIVAGVLFVLPAFFLMLGLSWAFVVHGDIDWVAAIFYGLQAAVVGIVFSAVIRVGSRALKTPVGYTIAVAAFVSLFFVKVPFPIVILVAGLIGWIGGRIGPASFPATIEAAASDDDSALIADHHDAVGDRSIWRTLRVLAVGLAVWWGPLLVVMLLRGTDDTLSKEAVFFSQAALVTFGGAYAVLSYIEQAAVQSFGWLDPGQMATGLGLAESTPGPLILVAEFVGFLGAYRFPGGLDPVVAGILGASVTVWATFAPCFLWIFLGAPYIEQLRGNRSLNTALGAITAAVVGVIMNLAVTFAIAVLFTEVKQGDLLGFTVPSPQLDSFDAFAFAIVVVAFAGLWRYRWNVLWVIGGSALAGLIHELV